MHLTRYLPQPWLPPFSTPPPHFAIYLQSALKIRRSKPGKYEGGCASAPGTRDCTNGICEKSPPSSFANCAHETSSTQYHESAAHPKHAERSARLGQTKPRSWLTPVKITNARHALRVEANENILSLRDSCFHPLSKLGFRFLISTSSVAVRLFIVNQRIIAPNHPTILGWRIFPWTDTKHNSLNTNQAGTHSPTYLRIVRVFSARRPNADLKTFISMPRCWKLEEFREGFGQAPPRCTSCHS